MIGTLLDIPRKTKDHTKARLDLIDLTIKEHLQPTVAEDGQHFSIPRISYSNEKCSKGFVPKGS